MSLLEMINGVPPSNDNSLKVRKTNKQTKNEKKLKEKKKKS